MNIAHGCLNTIQISTPALEELVFLARSNGALGAKITGAGGGGSIVALCPDAQEDVVTAMGNRRLPNPFVHNRVKPMRIATWNINGVRARIDYVKIWLESRTAPISSGFQEIKATEENLSYGGV